MLRKMNKIYVYIYLLFFGCPSHLGYHRALNRAPYAVDSHSQSLCHGILQAGVLEWVAISFSWGSSHPRDQSHISCIARGFFTYWVIQFSSVQFSRSVVSDSLRPHESQHARPPCPSPTPRVHSNSCPSSQWYHPAILSSVVPFSSCPQSLPASGSFPVSQVFASGGQRIGVSALTSVLPKNTQAWSPLGRTGWISLQSWGFPNHWI